MQYLAISLIFISILTGCAEYQHRDIFAQSKDWLTKTSERLEKHKTPVQKTDQYEAEVSALFDQPYIDPLTDYLNQHIDDQRRSLALKKVSVERKNRCQQIADKYAKRPLNQASLNRYQAGYSYSCPIDVESFALKLAAAQQSQLEQSSQQEQLNPVWIEVDEAIISNVNKEQLNDCYLLTTISNYREAKQACQSPAEAGDKQAQLNMALIHKALDEYPQALQWAQRVEVSSPRAAYLIGELYASGHGVSQSDQSAFDWFKKSAEQDYADAQYMTAWCYEKGVGTPIKIDKAMNWYQKAAMNDNVIAMYSLGAYLTQQASHTPSFKDGQTWLLKSARAGLAESSLLLGRLAEKSAESSKATALVWYEVAQQQGSAEAEQQAENLRKTINSTELNLARQQVHLLLEEPGSK